LNSTANRSAQVSSPSSRHDLDLTVTVVICTRNRPVLLRKCLEAVARLEPAPNELIVVDNTCGDQQVESVAQEFAARYTVEPIPGLSRARDRGLTCSSSKIVAYLDDDAVPDEHWLGFLLEPFADPRVAAVTGKILTPQSRTGDRAQEKPRALSNRDPQWFEIATFGGLGLGSNMALRKSACAGQKVFDERLGRGAPFQIAEENYAFASLLSRGYSAVYIPAAIVFHPPLKRSSIEQEARNSITYWLLLFSEFPGHRLDLLRFLFRRLRRKPLTWPRDPQKPGDIITSGWRVHLKAGLTGTLLFFRTRKSKGK
jgi:glycosyltransferase involved in cell wall biosynthesis